MNNFEPWDIAATMLMSGHTLIAGTTGSGKSVTLNTVLATSLDIQDAQYAFIDLKRVELRDYKSLPNCIGYATDEEHARILLDDVIWRMETRYEDMVGKESTSQHVYVVIDELADLVEDKTILSQLIKIGRLGRAAHIHLVMASQDPSRRTLKAQLMQNVTCALALRCRSDIESRQIVGVAGAEELPKHGKGILWDADGIRTVSIPMTPDETIKDLIRSRGGVIPLKTVYIPIFQNREQ